LLFQSLNINIIYPLSLCAADSILLFLKPQKSGRKIMEYLLVNFPEDREVVIDREKQGRTNEPIELEAGTPKVSLKSPPRDFRPRQRKVTLKGTCSLTHREVSFAKI
jgi:hypothetical protein